MPGLTRVGIAWALVSFLAALVSSVGYYLPYWLRGHMDRSDVYFGIFRRCNYPHLADSGQLIMVKECGRYTTFSDIPSFYWQIATVAIGTGCGLALLISLTSILAICIRDIFTPSVAKLAGVFQVIAGRYHIICKPKLQTPRIYI